MAGNNAIQVLRGTRSSRKSSSEYLLSGQPFYETDTNKLYIGNGELGNLTDDTLYPIGYGYDTVISTQEEFEAWWDECRAGTYAGTSILFLSGEYNLDYPRNSGISIPESVEEIRGIGQVKISCTDSFSGTLFDKQLSGQTDGVASIINIDTYIEYFPGNTAEVICFQGFNNVYSCKAVIIPYSDVDMPTTVAGFKGCANVVNCTVDIKTVHTAYGFDGCKYITNCQAKVDGSEYLPEQPRTISGFYQCTMLVNCSSEAIADPDYDSGYYDYTNCDSLSNCYAHGYFNYSNCVNVDPDTCPEYNGHLHKIYVNTAHMGSLSAITLYYNDGKKYVSKKVTKGLSTYIYVCGNSLLATADIGQEPVLSIREAGSLDIYECAAIYYDDKGTVDVTLGGEPSTHNLNNCLFFFFSPDKDFELQLTDYKDY